MKGSPLLGDLFGRSVPTSFRWHQYIATALTQASDGLVTWLERTRERRQLVALSDELLHDLGLSRFDVEREANKRFWQR